MAERPILAMPDPERRKPTANQRPLEKVRPADPNRQAIRLGPKFLRLEKSLRDPQSLAELREDPAAIVPERALVFEVASNIVDFNRAVQVIPTLEFLGEDEGEVAPDQDFFLTDGNNRIEENKDVPRRYYFTIPDQAALEELVSLWKRYKTGQSLGKNRAAWKKVFGYLADIRTWGLKDRLTEDATKDWSERLSSNPIEPIRFEVEFWYRKKKSRQQLAEAKFRKIIEEQNGQLLDCTAIDPIKYHAALAEVSPKMIQDVLNKSEVRLISFDDIMVIRPQSMVSGPVEAPLENATDSAVRAREEETGPPVAALLDGVPMAQHESLTNRLVIDDPDGFSNHYGSAEEQRHATAMASLILHGDLNSPSQVAPVRHQLYVRPIMYSQPYGFDSHTEQIPRNRLVIDLIWRAFIRMFDGEGDENATAPTVRVINLSLGDPNRRFARIMSPWARLMDYLAWQYGVLILVSAGNILDSIPLDSIGSWLEFENANEDERQTILLRAILKKRADRLLLSPSEAINALTVGAAHFDHLEPKGHGGLSIDPYANPFLPNPSSALGLGFKRTVKPEILFPGGAEHVRTKRSHEPIEVMPVKTGNYFGIGVASPARTGETNKQINMSGTSVATALATHNALRILESLDTLPDDPVHPKIDSTYHAVILKALLVHSAHWDQTAVNTLRSILNENGGINWQHERNEISRFLGFGCVDIKRVLDCTERRATLLGWNTISVRKTDRFQVPLPVELEGMAGFRALSVTIAWLTPTTLSHRNYRQTKFEAKPGQDKNFSLGVSNSKDQPHHYTINKGTVCHRRWEGKAATDFVDGGNLVLDVICSPTAGELDEDIQYAVVTSLEVGAEVAVPIYDRIRDQLRGAVPIKA